MADFSSKSDASFPTSLTGSGKRSTPNISSSWVIMLLSGLIAMVVFLAATASGSSKTQIVVANDDIATGAQIKSNDLHMSEVSLDKAHTERFILWSEKDNFIGYTSAGPIAKGDPVLRTQIRQAATSNGLNAMSIPIDPTRAAGGELAIGDRVDILDEEAGGYAARNIEVIAVREGSSGGALAQGNQFTVVVALNADQALAVGKAIKNQKMDIIRSTGGASPDRVTNSASNGSSTSTDSSSSNSNNGGNSTTTTTTKAQ